MPTQARFIFCLLMTGLFSLAATTPATAATYYCDPVNGNDANNGSSGSSWKTIARAYLGSGGSPEVVAGDTVILRSGSYGNFENVVENTTDWITYEKDTGATVVFDNIKLKSNTQVQLYLKFDGIRVICSEYGTFSAAGDYGVALQAVTHVILDNLYIEGAGAPENEAYGSGIIVFAQSGTEFPENITIQNTEITNVRTGIGFGSANNLTIDNVYIHDVFEDCLSGANLDDSTITNCNLAGGAPWYRVWILDTSDTVVGTFQIGETVTQDRSGSSAALTLASTRSGHLKLYLDDSGDSYTAFLNRDVADPVFTGSGLNDLTHGDLIWLYNYPHKVEIDGTGSPDTFKWYWYTGGEWVEKGANIEITGEAQELANDLTVTFNATTGHTIGDYWEMEPNTTYYLPVRGQNSNAYFSPKSVNGAGHGDLIQIYTQTGWIKPSTNVTISNNKLHYDGPELGGQAIFLKQMKNVIIENNLVYGVPRVHGCTLHVSSVSGTIRNNTFSFDNETANMTFYNNWFNWAEGTSYNVYTNVIVDANSSTIYGIKASHTASSDNKPGSGANWTDYWEDITSDMVFNVYNNVFCEIITMDDESYKTLNITNNIIGNTFGTGIPNNIGSNNHVYASNLSEEEEAALFSAPGSNDYTLSENSNAIDFANPDYAPATDILGNSRDANPDAGCYEYISSESGNSAPVLGSIGNKSVSENSALSFSVSATDADSDTITYSATGLPTGATFTGQSFSWTPDHTQAGTYQVVFTASDSSDSDSETITITVSNANRAPVLASIGDKSVGENSSLSFSVSATDADGETIIYSATGLPTGATFTSQSFSWTPGYTQSDSYQVTFVASDGNDSDSETITITVSNTNRPPVLASISNKSVSENSALSFSVSATDSDSDTITYSVQSLPSGAVFVSQTFTWTPGYTQSGTHQVSFTASDGTDSDSETINITVNNVNRVPVLSSIGDKSIFTENSLTFTISATDADSDTMTYSATNLPSGATFSGQNFSWTPDSSQEGSYNVTFTASDSTDQDSEVITITVTADSSVPTVTNLSPADDSIQAPLNSLIYLSVADSGKGINASTVTIEVNNNLVYTGDTSNYNSSYGSCQRIGTNAAYKYIYQAGEKFDDGQTITVTVNATDLAANSMDEYSYSFKTEMRSFGENKKVNSSSDTLNESGSATVSDSSGNIWAVWHTGQTGSRDIYISKLTAGADSFSNSVRVTNDDTDQCNPIIEIDSADKLYVAWQDSRNGEWDVYVSTSTDGASFSTERKITDPNSDQINPAIVIDSSNKAYIVWEDDRNNNQDIYIASSSNSFVNYTTSQITSNTSGQTAPAIAVDSGDIVYVVWVDARGSTNDIYGADSANGPWTNVAVVSNVNNQSSPVIATEASGTILHLLWVDNTSGDNDIYYASSDGLSGSSLTGSSIIDDNSGASQSVPVITVTGSTGNSLKVFACWKDERNVSSGNGDTDIYFVEANSDSETNVLVGDDSTNSAQSYPALGIDGYEYPYLVWTDSRSTSTDIYYAGSTFVESTVLESEDVTVSSGVTVGTELANINSTTDVSVIIPVGASLHDATITISRVKNPQKLTLDRFSIPYEFGPSGIEFDQPVTIIIPYDVSAGGHSPSAYWYDPLTDLLSQQGITDVEIIEISSTLYALRFKTTHFTQFLVGDTLDAVVGGGGGGGGGCSMSPNGQGSIVEFLLPYIGLAVVMTILKLQDKRKKKMHDCKN